jgi:hypothetical protein
MANLLPVNQILAVKNRHAGKIFKRAGNEIIIVAHAANARIGIKAGDEWIGKNLRRAKVWQRAKRQQQQKVKTSFHRHFSTTPGYVREAR